MLASTRLRTPGYALVTGTVGSEKNWLASVKCCALSENFRPASILIKFTFYLFSGEEAKTFPVLDFL
jgi:hypothetical protein